MSSNSKIKSIYLPLICYRFDHGPSDNYSSNPNFIGREDIIERLTLLLNSENSKSKNGAYLVSGYRGMGKTSLVREAIFKVNNENNNKSTEQKKLKSFEFSLSQGDVKELDVLRQIAWKLNRYIHDELKFNEAIKIDFGKKLKNSLFALLVTISFFAIYLNIDYLVYKTKDANIEKTNHSFTQISKDQEPTFSLPLDNSDLGTALLFFLGFFIILSLFMYNSKRKKTEEKGYHHIRRILELNATLKDRLYSNLVQEDGKEGLFSLGSENPVTYLTNSILDTVRGHDQNTRNTLSYEKATPKEIEQFLYEILLNFNQLREIQESDLKIDVIPPFVFVIDELDKIEPEYQTIKYTNENNSHKFLETAQTKSRVRNEAISSLLANLKNFLSNAPAKFIFVGGRGMYDAALADISDRESFYSSIFNEILYVPSFFKDKITPQAQLSQLTENYLCSLFIENEPNKKECHIQRLLDDFEVRYPIQLSNVKIKFKLLHTLQNFIIYLTYRSNGTPKKLIELIEKYIVKIDSVKIDSTHGLFFKGNSNDSNHKGLYIKIGYRDQYEINLHSNIYRPYLLFNAKHLKLLGDKLLYSSAFIIDHILKFHNGAFSWRNIEIVPDIVLASKDPNFRQFYTEIMGFMQKQHIRRTVNTIFEYKFNIKTANEIKYSSKISESSSAAFNFTTDESHHLKSYYKAKLREQYEMIGHSTIYNSEKTKFTSIISLHALLGDLHYHDEEYIEAITYYNNALLLSKTETTNKDYSMSSNIIDLAKNSLSLGLCYEKTRTYDKAYSIYRDLIIDLISFIDETSSGGGVNGEKNGNTTKGEWEKPYKRMQLFQKPFLALLSVIEKSRQDGITYDNLERNFEEYIKFLKLYNNEYNLFPIKLQNHSMIYEDLDMNTLKINSDKKRKITLICDYYFMVGSMLFYKNEIFYRLLYHRTPIDNVTIKIIENLKNKHEDYHPSHAAYVYYLYSLITFNVPYKENIDKLKKDIPELTTLDRNENELIPNLKFTLNFLYKGMYSVLNSEQCDFLGNILGKLSDSILSCLSKKDTLDNDTWIYISLFDKDDFNISKIGYIDKIDNALSLKSVFILLRMSYHFYIKSGKPYSALFQIKKMLYVLKEEINDENKFEIQNQLNIESLSELIFKLLIDVSGISIRSQLNKFRIQTDGESEYTPLLYQNLSNSGEIKEYLILFSAIKHKLGEGNKYHFDVDEYSTVSSMFARSLELKFKADLELNDIKKELSYKKSDDVVTYIINALIKNDDKILKIKNQIVNAYFCLYENLRIINTYSVDYVISNSFKANLSTKMAETCFYFTAYNQAEKFLKSIDFTNATITDEIVKLIGSTVIYSTDAYEYIDIALNCYKQTIDLHSEGITYKDLSKEMYLLNDDFNDNLTHFCAAMERFEINTGKIRLRINELNELINTSQLLKIDNYVK